MTGVGRIYFSNGGNLYNVSSGVFSLYEGSDAAALKVKSLLVNESYAADAPSGGMFKLGSGTITWDSTNNCFHFSHGLYSDSFVSAKGANSGSGGTVSGVTKLSDLSDVQLGTLATNQVLSWNGSKWVNKAISTGLDETALAQYLTNNQYITMPTGDGRYVTINTDQTITGEKTFANSFSFKYDVDTSRVYTINFNDTSNETMGSIGYLNVSKFFFINPIGSSNPWQDSVGKYNLIIGNNKLTYNTYPILTSNNYASTLDNRYLRTVSLATISDLHSSWDALLKAAPSVYVTRWPTASEVGALIRDNNASGTTTDTNSALSNAVTHNYRWSNAPYNGISSLFDISYSNDWRTQLFVKHQASTDIRVRSRYSGTTWGSWRTIAFTDSNVYSATKLQTAQNIWGRPFDGTAPVSGDMFKLGSGTITWDSTNNCFHFSHGLYSDSFVSAKGANSGSGGTVSGVTKLSDLSDVQLGTLATNQVLSWNGSKWVNKAISTGLDETALAQYLTNNQYLTMPTGDGRYALKDGTNATATWPIAISVKDIRDTSPTPNDKADRAVDFWFNNTGKPGSDAWYSGITVKGWSDGYAVWQLASASSTALSDDNLYFRSGLGTTWKSWRKILDTTNYTSTLDSRYLRTVSLATISDLHASWDSGTTTHPARRRIRTVRSRTP